MRCAEDQGYCGVQEDAAMKEIYLTGLRIDTHETSLR